MRKFANFVAKVCGDIHNIVSPLNVYVSDQVSKVAAKFADDIEDEV